VAVLLILAISCLIFRGLGRAGKEKSAKVLQEKLGREQVSRP